MSTSSSKLKGAPAKRPSLTFDQDSSGQDSSSNPPVKPTMRSKLNPRKNEMAELGGGLELNTRTRYYKFPFEDGKLENYFIAKRTTAGYTIVTIHGECYPARRDPVWHAQQEAVMGTRAYRREHKIDWTTSDGDVYYPEFASDPYKYVDHRARFVKGLPVHRGWDFGFRRPACVFSQNIGGRLVVLRELMPENISSHAWAKLVLYCSGEITRDALGLYPRALTYAMKLEEMEPTKWSDGEWEFPKPPWFPEGTRFIDYSGPECYAVGRQIEREDEARNDYEILANYGIVLGVLSTRIAARNAVLRRLFAPTAGGPPRFVISPHCRDLLAGLAGGIAYKKGSELDPEPNTPSKDGFYEHLHDALGYSVVNIWGVTEEERPAAAPGPIREAREWTAEEDRHQYVDSGIFEDPSEDW